MTRLRSIATLTAVLALSLPAAAVARPADVVIVNGPSNPAVVQVTGTPSVTLDPSGNDVEVQSSVGSPVHTRAVPEPFGSSVSLSASNGAIDCESFAVPAGRVVQLSTMIVGATGPATPRVWLDFYARNASASLKQELEVPLRASQTSNFTFTGQIATGFPIFGGGVFAGNGVPTEVRGCLRAAASGSTLANLTITGTYLD